MRHFIPRHKMYNAMNIVDLFFRESGSPWNTYEYCVRVGMLSSLATFKGFCVAKLGNKLLFCTTCHPQTGGQAEIINRTLAQLLRPIMNKNLKIWEDCLPSIEFADDKTMHFTTCSPFEIEYDFNPRTPLNISHLPVDEQGRFDEKKKDELIRTIHKKVRLQI